MHGRHRLGKLVLGLAALGGALAGTSARASEIEAAAAQYDDERLTSTVASTAVSGETRALAPGEGTATSARLSAMGKRIRFKTLPDLLKKQTSGEDTIEERTLSASIDQGLGVGTTVGLLGGSTNSPLTHSRHYGVRAGQWWRQETLQTTLELRRTFVSQPPIEFTDTDGKRVETPADLDGANAGLTVMHFTTPTTILRGSVSRTERSDRPPATAASGEVRQFIDPAQAAVHATLTHYENTGRIDPTQTYGQVVADSVKLEWHQRLPGSLILMGGYRYYIEHEKPRAEDAARKQLGADDLFGSLRWRLGEGAWTDDASELYLFGARYQTNAPAHGRLIGAGVRWQL